MRIDFRRAGGFAGRVTRLELDLDQLGADERAALERLVADAGLCGTDACYRSERRDAFEYTISVDDGGVRHEVTADDGAAPAPLRALIDALLARARTRSR